LPNIISPEFEKSPEYAMRRLVRSIIRKTDKLSKHQRDILLAIVNLWVHHKNGPKGYIHPGKKMLAKKARVSLATVKRTLKMLRGERIIIPRKYLKGGAPGCATQYTVNVEMLILSYADMRQLNEAAEWFRGGPLTEVNFDVSDGGQGVSFDPLTDPDLTHLTGVTVTHCLKYTAKGGVSPFQENTFLANVTPLGRA